MPSIRTSKRRHSIGGVGVDNLASAITDSLALRNTPSTPSELAARLEGNFPGNCSLSQVLLCLTKSLRSRQSVLTANSNDQVYIADLPVIPRDTEQTPDQSSIVYSPESCKSNEITSAQIEQPLVAAEGRIGTVAQPSLELDDLPAFDSRQFDKFECTSINRSYLNMNGSELAQLHFPIELAEIDPVDAESLEFLSPSLEINPKSEKMPIYPPSPQSQLAKPFLEFTKPFTPIPKFTPAYVRPGLDMLDLDQNDSPDLDMFVDFSHGVVSRNADLEESNIHDWIPNPTILFEQKPAYITDPPIFLAHLLGELYYISWQGKVRSDPIRLGRPSHFYVGRASRNKICTQKASLTIFGGAIPILRNVNHATVNATMLLAAAGVSELERSIILSLERQRVNTAAIKGSWIPLLRARALAQSCCLNEQNNCILSDQISVENFNSPYSEPRDTFIFSL